MPNQRGNNNQSYVQSNSSNSSNFSFIDKDNNNFGGPSSNNNKKGSRNKFYCWKMTSNLCRNLFYRSKIQRNNNPMAAMRNKFYKKKLDYLNKKEHAQLIRDSIPALKDKADPRLAWYQARKMKNLLDGAYFLQTLIRLVIECGFIYFFHQHFSLTINPLFKCREHPCPNTVDCFVSRPLEKQFVTQFLYSATLLSICLVVLDLFWVILKQIRSACKTPKIDCELTSLEKLTKQLDESRTGMAKNYHRRKNGGLGAFGKFDNLDSESKLGGSSLDDFDDDNMIFEAEEMDDNAEGGEDDNDQMDRDNEDAEAEMAEMEMEGGYGIGQGCEVGWLDLS